MDDKLKLSQEDLSDEDYRQLVTEFLINTCKIASPSEELVNLAVIAFTTPEYANETKTDNLGKLSFYGHAATKQVICECLYSEYKLSEGYMTAVAEHLWHIDVFPECVYRAGIKFIYLLRINNGVRKNAVDEVETMLLRACKSFDALIGALYRTKHFEEAKKLVIASVKQEMKYCIECITNTEPDTYLMTISQRSEKIKNAFLERFYESNKCD